MASYCDSAAVAVALDLTIATDTLDTAVVAASEAIRNWCGRDFSVADPDDGDATSRYFDPQDAYCVRIDDCQEVTALATDDTADGTWGTSWSASDYQTTPTGQTGPYGATGWPYTAVVAVGRTFSKPSTSRLPYVRVTARWGWAAVPTPVKQATIMLAAELYKATREAPLGTAGMSDFGPIVIRGNRRIQDLVQGYRRSAGADGRFLVA